MQLTPEIKQQLAEQKKQCIFCKIIAKEMDSKIVFEDNLTMAVLDIYPAIKGHTTFFLKEHYPIMPYIPANEFKHFFGLIPELSKAIKGAMLSTGINVFVANGGAAGQRSPHFMIHLFPRENEDKFFNFLFKRKCSLPEKESNMLANNLPIMMRNHFTRNPAAWHQGKGNVPSHLTEIYESNKVIYEDEKVVCILPKKAVVEGHMEIYSKEEDKEIEKLDNVSAAHLFYVASFAATAVFEGLGAHATNIILKSGVSDDNPTGKLCVHILPRKQGDSLQSLNWEPKPPKYDLNGVKEKIKGKTWKIGQKVKETKTVIKRAPVIKMNQKTSKDEIAEAIASIKN